MCSSWRELERSKAARARTLDQSNERDRTAEIKDCILEVMREAREIEIYQSFIAMMSSQVTAMFEVG